MVDKPVKKKRLPLTIVSNKKLLKNKIPIARDKEKYYYIEKKDIPDDEVVTELDVNDVVPIPYLDVQHNQRSAVYISAMSGSGKSTLCAKLVKEQLKLLKDEEIPDKPVERFDLKTRKKYIAMVPQHRKIVLITVTDNLDPAFESAFGNNPNFVHIPTSTDPDYLMFTMKNFAYCTVIFDDYENKNDKVTTAFTLGLITQLLEHSRKLHTHLFLLTHVTQNFNKTKDIIFECSTFFTAPFSNKNSVKKFLKSYGDVSDEEIETMIDDSMEEYTFLSFHKSYPRYYITYDKIALL